MADVQEIEAAVGKGVGEAARAVLLTRSTSAARVEDFSHRWPAGLKSRPYVPSHGDRRGASSAADTVAVPRFITTRPPA